MQITNMEQVKENIGKRVLFKTNFMNEIITGTIVFGEHKDCDRVIVGYENKYSIIYDKKREDGINTWFGYLEESDFYDIEVFEVIKENSTKIIINPMIDCVEVWINNTFKSYNTKRYTTEEIFNEILNLILSYKYNDDEIVGLQQDIIPSIDIRGYGVVYADLFEKNGLKYHRIIPYREDFGVKKNDFVNDLKVLRIIE